MNGRSRKDAGGGLLDREAAIARFGPDRDFTLVFTNGCFDRLHEGHRALLRRAATFGDRLLVGLNTDASVRRLKGPGRPATPETDRAGALLALAEVDAVTLFDEDTPLALIEALRPDVIVKGADYALDEIVGREIVEATGGRVERVALVPGVSTTRLLDEQSGEGR